VGEDDELGLGPDCEPGVLRPVLRPDDDIGPAEESPPGRATTLPADAVLEDVGADKISGPFDPDGNFSLPIFLAGGLDPTVAFRRSCVTNRGSRCSASTPEDIDPSFADAADVAEAEPDFPTTPAADPAAAPNDDVIADTVPFEAPVDGAVLLDNGADARGGIVTLAGEGPAGAVDLRFCRWMKNIFSADSFLVSSATAADDLGGFLVIAFLAASAS
jgi:hypothetical protein